MKPKTVPSTDISIFTAIRDHKWDEDLEFRNGLQKIISQFPSGDANSLIMNAKCFYWKRNMGVAVDAEAFKNWLASDGAPRVSARTEASDSLGNDRAENKDNAPHSDAFSRIIELINSGEPIPGIKEIPDIINEEPPSQSATAERKKPWENYMFNSENSKEDNSIHIS